MTLHVWGDEQYIDKHFSTRDGKSLAFLTALAKRQTGLRTDICTDIVGYKYLDVWEHGPDGCSIAASSPTTRPWA